MINQVQVSSDRPSLAQWPWPLTGIMRSSNNNTRHTAHNTRQSVNSLSNRDPDPPRHPKFRKGNSSQQGYLSNRNSAVGICSGSPNLTHESPATTLFGRRSMGSNPYGHGSLSSGLLKRPTDGELVTAMQPDMQLFAHHLFTPNGVSANENGRIGTLDGRWRGSRLTVPLCTSTLNSTVLFRNRCRQEVVCCSRCDSVVESLVGFATGQSQRRKTRLFDGFLTGAAVRDTRHQRVINNNKS